MQSSVVCKEMHSSLPQRTSIFVPNWLKRDAALHFRIPLLLSRVAFTSHGASVARSSGTSKFVGFGSFDGITKKTTRAKLGRILLYLRQLEVT